jgi:hypothetical protein
MALFVNIIINDEAYTFLINYLMKVIFCLWARYSHVFLRKT